MVQAKLSDVLGIATTDRLSGEIVSKFDTFKRLPSSPLLIRYSTEVQNAAAGKRAPVARVEWENYWNAEIDFKRER